MSAPASIPDSASDSSRAVVRVSVAPVRRPKPGLRAQLLQLLLIALLALASYGFISHFLVSSVKVVGESMYPTLHNADFYLLNRWVLYLRCPQRTEIVVLRDPLEESFAVKRVVGTPGDRLLLKAGEVYLNGRKLEESYLPPGTPTFAAVRNRVQSFKCGPQQYFVMGDNRGNSIDSRVYGPVSRREILGLIIH